MPRSRPRSQVASDPARGVRAHRGPDPWYGRSGAAEGRFAAPRGVGPQEMACCAHGSDLASVPRHGSATASLGRFRAGGARASQWNAARGDAQLDVPQALDHGHTARRATQPRAHGRLRDRPSAVARRQPGRAVGWREPWSGQHHRRDRRPRRAGPPPRAGGWHRAQRHRLHEGRTRLSVSARPAYAWGSGHALNRRHPEPNATDGLPRGHGDPRRRTICAAEST